MSGDPVRSTNGPAAQVRAPAGAAPSSLTEGEFAAIVAFDADADHDGLILELRREETLDRWLQALYDLNSRLTARLDGRRMEYERRRLQAVGAAPDERRAFGRWKLEYLAREKETKEFRRRVGRRIREAKRHVAERNRQRNGAARAGKKDERLREALAEGNRRQDAYRATLLSIQDFLCLDACFKPEFLPVRDELLARLEGVLYPKGRKSSEPPPQVARALARTEGAP